jgi:hypothetical protein
MRMRRLQVEESAGAEPIDVHELRREATLEPGYFLARYRQLTDVPFHIRRAKGKTIDRNSFEHGFPRQIQGIPPSYHDELMAALLQRQKQILGGKLSPTDYGPKRFRPE